MYKSIGLSGHYRLLYFDRLLQKWLISDDDLTFEINKQQLIEYLNCSSEPCGLVYERYSAHPPPVIHNSVHSKFESGCNKFSDLRSCTTIFENNITHDTFDIRYRKKVVSNISSIETTENQGIIEEGASFCEILDSVIKSVSSNKATNINKAILSKTIK